MAIPYTDDFQEFLSCLRRSKPLDSSGYEKYIVAESRQSIDNTSRVSYINEAALWFKSSCTLKMDRVVSRMVKELEAQSHPSSTEIAAAALLLMTYHTDFKERPVDVLNQIINSIISPKVYQYYIFPFKDYFKIETARFGDYQVDKLDHQQFEYRCKKATSDYFDLYRKELINAFSISRTGIKIKIIDWNKFYFEDKSIGLDPYSMYKDHLLTYYEYVSQHLSLDFWEEFDEQQDFQISMGFPPIEGKSFQNSGGSQFVTIFSELEYKGKRYGYVVPQAKTSTLHIDLTFPVRLFSFYKDVKSAHSFVGFTNSSIHQTMKIFVKFVSKGRRFIDEKKIDEGFLHLVIALDLLFGDKNASTLNISSKTAFLTYASFSNAYEHQKKLVGDVYENRSRYVHSGSPVKADLVEKTIKICNEVLMCLLRIQKLEIYQNDSFLDLWKKKIEYATLAIGIGKTLTIEEMLEIGLPVTLE